MGNHKSVILLGAAIVIALFTSLLVYGYLQRKGKVQEVVIETQAVIVAAVDLSWGTALTKEMMKQADFLKGSLGGEFFTDPSSLIGRVLIYPVKANEPIFESRLAPVNIKTGGVAAVITSKKRAVAVKVDKVIGVSGFIHPGNRVDVLVTLSTGRTVAPMAKTILENILVLAVGTETQERKGVQEKASPADVITLEVTPGEAERLALAATEGRLQLALRNFSDHEGAKTRGTTLPNLLGSRSYRPPAATKPVTRKTVESKKPEPEPPPAPPVVTEVETKKHEEVETKKPEEVEIKKPAVFTVELIKGSKVSKVVFEGSEE